MEISRRSFVSSAVAGLALGTAGIVAGGACAFADEADGATEATEATEATDTTQAWVDSAEVLIVGGGGAGFAAAIEAAEAGCDVLVLEKAGFCGGDTLRSGGMIMVGGSDMQAEFGIEDTPERFAQTELAYCGEYADADMVTEMCLSSVEEFEFMQGLGRVYDAISSMKPVWAYDIDGVWAPRTHWQSSSSGEGASDEERAGHFAALEAKATELGVRVKTSTEVAHLIKDADAGVIGVEAADGSCYRATRGVVVSTASFGKNMEMSRRYNQMNYWALRYEEAFDDPCPNVQCSTNTGDGIRMIQEIGGDLALSPANCISSIPCISVTGDVNGLILVNKEAKRFVQENAHWGYLNQVVFNECLRLNSLEPATGTIWAIADQTSVDANYYYSSAVYSWGVTESVDYAQHILQADTIEELAELAGLPADTLVETVERWNEMAQAGEDTDFSRCDYNGSDDMGTIETPPFYAFPYIPYSMGSFGGVRTDIETQVLDVSGEVIPRLFAAGAVMSGMYTAPFYNACGWSILGTVHWGRKAGVNAAALEPWTDEEIVVAESDDEADVQAAIDAAAGSYVAGAYEATAAGRNGDFVVTVEFSETAITSVEVGENAETEGIGSVAIEQLPESVLLAQSADVDVVAGATITSEALLAAVQECIDQASA